MKRNNLFAVTAILLTLGTAAAAPAQQVKASGTLGVDVGGMDRSIRPQDDFFRFVNGGWLDRTEIPADMSRYGSFVDLREKSADALKVIIESAAASKSAPGTVAQKVGDYYRSFMDSARIESLGIKPLEPELATIAKVKGVADLPMTFVELARIGVRAPLGLIVMQDQKQSDAYVVTVSQAGLGLPDRDYYLRSDERFANIRKQYTNYIATLFRLAGQKDPEGAAQRILALETRIAEKHWDRARNRDRNATYNKMAVADVANSVPAFQLPAVLKALSGTEIKDVIVRQPDYLPAINAIVTETPIDTWKEYLTAALLNRYADELPHAFVEADFNFSGKVIAGQMEMRPRWKRGVAEVEGALGEAVGKLYVEKHFTPQAKARMDELVKNLIAAYKEGIDELEWMSPETKAQAQDKLSKFTVKIGYPDRWRDYSALQVSATDLIGNVKRSRRFNSAEIWSRLGKPAERWRWGMTPQTVNAYYNATNNEIVFPAAILQPPFFNMEADDAVNYGAIGAVIGHEISHGFDDQGRKSDGSGNLRDWWTADDAKKFEDRAAKLGAQYESYQPLEGIKINGKLTMGENIGDLSGLAGAYKAYRMSLGGKEAPVIDGFTGDQRFFLGYAQIWRGKSRDEFLRNQLLTDSHSPEKYRALVPLTNFEPFYKAFDLKPGDKMYRAPEERVKIW